MNRFGEKLRRLRRAAGMSQQELAGKVGYTSQTYLSEIEAGSKHPTSELVVKVARLFGVSTDLLLIDEIENSLHPGVISLFLSNTDALPDSKLSYRDKVRWNQAVKILLEAASESDNPTDFAAFLVESLMKEQSGSLLLGMIAGRVSGIMNAKREVDGDGTESDSIVKSRDRS